jgi:mRNA-degrading endonuclease toxin of MazEF toxin-antitoxin module
VVQRGEVWWADIPRGNRHPVLLLSWDAHRDWRDRVTVAEITGTERGIDSEVRIGKTDGMTKKCWVNLDGIVTIRRTLLQSRLATLSFDRMAEVERAVHLALGIPIPCQVTA